MNSPKQIQLLTCDGCIAFGCAKPEETKTLTMNRWGGGDNDIAIGQLA